MRTYRLFFYDHHMVGQFDFAADHDDEATATAEILFDACSDRCEYWELWEGNVFLASGPMKIRLRGWLSDFTERRQENIAECEEAILQSTWAIASSERLLAQLGKLKASKAGASRYSTLA
jgi:hypothetical protein